MERYIYLLSPHQTEILERESKIPKRNLPMENMRPIRYFVLIVSGLLESHSIVSSGKGGRRNQTLAWPSASVRFL